MPFLAGGTHSCHLSSMPMGSTTVPSIVLLALHLSGQLPQETSLRTCLEQVLNRHMDRETHSWLSALSSFALGSSTKNSLQTSIKSP